MISIRYPSGSRTKHSREPPSRTEYGGFSGSMPCSARRASVASRSSAVIAMWPQCLQRQEAASGKAHWAPGKEAP